MRLRRSLLPSLFLLSACSDPSTDTCGTGRCLDAARESSASEGGRTDGPSSERPTIDAGDPHASEVVDLAIDPPMANLVVRDPASPPTQQFTALAVRRDGARVPLLSPVWSVSDTALASINGTGLLTPTGLAGGTLQVRLEGAGFDGSTLRAQAQVTVRVERSLLAPGVPAEIPGRIAGATPSSAAAPTLLYPLSGAWMPNNVPPPDVQWTPVGAANDVYRVRIEKADLLLTAYVLHSGASFSHDWLVPRDLWRTVADTHPGTDTTITVDRWDAAASQLTQSAFVRVRLTASPIAGSIYYWDLNDGRIQRIDPSQPVPMATPAIPNPPRNPTDANNRCVACHTISRSGRFLSGELWGGGLTSAVFDLTSDLTRDPASTTFAPGTASWLYSSFNPDDTRLAANNGAGLAILDPATGRTVVAPSALPSRVAHPEWSPDGANIALAANIAGTWAVDFSSSDLALLPAMAGDTFGGLNILLHGADLASSPEGGAAISHPTWSPDSRYLAFGHGTHSRSVTRDAANNPTVQPGALYLTTRDGMTRWRLDNANGGASARNTFWPTFSPFTTTEAGGAAQQWLAFYSTRDYGNALAGTQGRGARQLWVTAVDARPTSGTDPSHVPYWISGQVLRTDNMAAYWAAQACRMNGTTCTTSSECCSGQCRPDPMMPSRFTCQPPPPAECRREGATCGGSGDCCSGLQCVGNVCQQPPPG